MNSSLGKTLGMLVILILVLVAPVNGFILDQHVAINREALESVPNSPLAKEILPYRDYFDACNQGTDISVVSYFTIDNDEDDGFFGKLFKIFQFRIGKTYRATHSQNACLRAISEATTPQERACGYGICSHLVQDAVSHNKGVPLAIKKTKLFNGLVHSIKEIHDKDLMATPADTARSRQTLDLLYEMTPYFERVFVQDPAFSKVQIPEMIDFFVKNVQPEGEYRLGFRSFFALPTYIYWVLIIFFFLSLGLAAYSGRKIKDGEANIGTNFSLVLGLIMLGVIGTAFYGLIQGNIWRMWEIVSQWLFSPAMYGVGALFVLIGIITLYPWIKNENKIKNIATFLVAVFLLLIGGFMLTLPNGLTTGNEQAIHNLAVSGTEQFLQQGVNYVKTIEDPVGYNALRNADAAGQSARTIFLITIIGLLAGILYSTFRRKKK